MTIGSGIAITGAFLGTALAFMFAPELTGNIFVAPTIAAVVIAMAN